MKACHGSSVHTHGTPLASHWSATGFTVSGPEPTHMMWMPLTDQVAGHLFLPGRCRTDCPER